MFARFRLSQGYLRVIRIFNKKHAQAYKHHRSHCVKNEYNKNTIFLDMV